MTTGHSSTTLRKIVEITAGFPVISETFILDMLTGLIDRQLPMEHWTTDRIEQSTIHPNVLKYDLMNRTKFLKIPPLVGNDSAWTLQFCRLNSIDSIDTIDAYHVHFGTTFLRLAPYFRINQQPLIVSFHGFDASRTFLELGDHCYDELFARASLITTPSHIMKAALTSRGCPEQKIRVHRYGIDITKFHPQEKPLRPDRIELLTVGRFVEKKGIGDSLRAFAKLPNRERCRYRIIGNGPLLEEMQAIIAETGISKLVELLGEKTSDEVAQAMRETDIFILTSVTASTGDQEGLPVSLIEAHTNGLPVISTIHAGIPELVAHGETGLLAAEHDIDTIASHLFRLTEDDQLRANMARNARIRAVKEFNIVSLNDKLAGYFFELHAQHHEEVEDPIVKAIGMAQKGYKRAAKAQLERLLTDPVYGEAAVKALADLE